MAKRPSSQSTNEADAAKNSEPATTVDDAMIGSVAMQEPPTVDNEPSVEPSPFSTPVEPAAVEPAMEPTPQPEPVAPPPSQPAPPQRRNGGTFLGTALGGVVAAAAGYALAIFVPFPGMGTSGAPDYATQAEVQALTGRIDTLESLPAPDATLADRIAALEARPEAEPAPQQNLTPVQDALAALEDRIAGIEARGPVASGDAPSAELVTLVESLQAEVAEMRAVGADASAGLEALTAQTEARLAEAEAQAAALREEAEATARRALSAAALGRVQAALESGAPFAGALSDMAGIEIPDALAGLAETGVPSRAALEEAFPAAARAALEASLRADMGEGWSERLGIFLQTTAGVRSLSPREGTDPDAVLSRAEAAVKAGDFAQSLTELQGLPPEGLAEMADWSASAQQRIDAITAVAALSAAVEG